MTPRIFAIGFIYFCCSIAWAILGDSVTTRTREGSEHLRENVQSIWGSPQTQLPPVALYNDPIVHETKGDDGKTKTATTMVERHLPVSQSRVNVDLGLDHRRKGLVWYSTYAVAYQGEYHFLNDTGADRKIGISFPLPEGQALYDGFEASIDGRPVKSSIVAGKIYAVADISAGQTIRFRTKYSSQGLDRWTYAFARGTGQVNDFQLTMRTNFGEIDFPGNSLAATTRKKTAEGWELQWNYTSLLSGLDIAMAMPAKLQPGELVSRICYFAPVSLMFFFFLMFILTLLKKIEIHPMNYFFLAASFFAFHLLLAYTADLIDLHLAFFLSAAVSIFLVVSYLRLVVGMRFALLEAGALQLLYLVGFSYAFFLKGYSALSVTIGSIITLFIVMQLTGRIRWSEVFSKQSPAPPPPPASGSEDPLPPGKALFN